MRVTVRLDFNSQLHQEGRWWVATCPGLDVVTQGQTREEAKTNLEEALTFFVESCVERGTIFQVLEQAGFERRPESKETAENESLSISVPLPFMITHGGTKQVDETA